MVQRPEVGYAFYWNYISKQGFSVLSYKPEEMSLKEKVYLNLKVDRFLIVNDTILVLSDGKCYMYLIAYGSENPIKLLEFKECNEKTFFAYDTGGLYIGVPQPRSLKIYKYKDGKFTLYEIKRFKREITMCDAVKGKFYCVYGKYHGETGDFVYDSVYYLIDGYAVKVFENDRKIYEKTLKKKPLSVSISHGFLYISTAEGIHCIDLNTKAEGFVEFPSVKVYSSKYSFIVLVEDMDGCINLFKPIFRPPSLKFIKKADTRFCK